MLARQVIEAYSTFLEALGRTQRTIETNRERLMYFHRFLSENGIGEIEEVTPEEIDRYIASLYRKNLSVYTIAGRIQVIKTFFAWSDQRNYVEKSPASHLKEPRLNYASNKKAILQKDLESMILAARKHHFILEEAMLMFFADTGCRSGELCSINLSDIDFSKEEVVVQGKTGERILDFTEKTAVILKRYLSIRSKELNTQSQALFIDREGQRITTNKVYMGFRRIARSLNIERFNPHAIRHRVGQGWLDQGTNLELVRQKLGHKDIKTTALYYSHQDRDRSKNATKKFSFVKDVQTAVWETGLTRL